MYIFACATYEYACVACIHVVKDLSCIMPGGSVNVHVWMDVHVLYGEHWYTQTLHPGFEKEHSATMASKNNTQPHSMV